MREQRGAATAIQARYRQRAAQREVAVRRKEHEDRGESAERARRQCRSSLLWGLGFFHWFLCLGYMPSHTYRHTWLRRVVGFVPSHLHL